MCEYLCECEHEHKLKCKKCHWHPDLNENAHSNVEMWKDFMKSSSTNTVCISIEHIPQPQPFRKSSHIPKHISGAKYHWATHFSSSTHKHHHSFRLVKERACCAVLCGYVQWILSTACVKAHRVIYKRMQLKYRLTYMPTGERVQWIYQNESIHDVVTNIPKNYQFHERTRSGDGRKL